MRHARNRWCCPRPRVPTEAELKAAYLHVCEDVEACALNARAKDWRAAGDHIAAGDCERAAAEVFRYRLNSLLRGLACGCGELRPVD
ncbi:MAG: hypothetical protein Q8Q14_16190 [Gemmatimonadales bacterium]|nr:hypothetical protein [Gemmatimonadales bacterium]